MQLKTSEGTHCIRIEHCKHVLIWKTKEVAMFWGDKEEYIAYIFLISNKIVS